MWKMSFRLAQATPDQHVAEEGLLESGVCSLSTLGPGSLGQPVLSPSLDDLASARPVEKADSKNKVQSTYRTTAQAALQPPHMSMYTRHLQTYK